MLVGLDIHKNYIQAAVMNEQGRLLKKDKFRNDLQSVQRFFTNIREAKVVMESSSTWYHVYRFLSKKYNVILSNPVKTKAIASAKIKTDKINARALADLLRGGYIAECYVPDSNIDLYPIRAGTTLSNF
jgi:transposase